MTVVVLTDLSSGATIFTLKRNDNDTISVVIFEDLTVSQALSFIASHISEACVPISNYVVKQGEKEADITLRTFKKARVSALEDCVEWEQFQDMLQDCQPGTKARAEKIINQLYRSCDFSPPAFLSKFV